MAYQCVNCDTVCENRKSSHRSNRHFAISSRLQEKVREKDKLKPNISIIEGIEEIFEGEVTKHQLDRFAGCFMCKECHLMLRLAVNTKSEVEQCMSSLHERIDGITSKSRRQYYREHYATHKAGKCWGCMFDFSEVFYTSRCVRFRMSAILFEEMTVEEGIKTLLEEEADALHGLFSKNTYLCKACFQLMRQIVKLQCHYETLHASFTTKTTDNSIIALLLRGEMPSVVSSVFSVKGIATAGNSQTNKGISSATSSQTSKGISSAACSKTSKGISSATSSQTSKGISSSASSQTSKGISSTASSQTSKGISSTASLQTSKGISSTASSQTSKGISSTASLQTSKGISSAASSQTSKGISSAASSQTSKGISSAELDSNIVVESQSNEGFVKAVNSQSNECKQSNMSTLSSLEISNAVNSLSTGKPEIIDKHLNSVAKSKEEMDEVNVVDCELCKDSNRSVRTLRGQKRKCTNIKVKLEKSTNAKRKRTKRDGKLGNDLGNEGEVRRDKCQDSDGDPSDNCNSTADATDGIRNVVLECDMIDEDEFNGDNNYADKDVKVADVAPKNLKVITSIGSVANKNTCVTDGDKSQDTCFDVLDNQTTVMKSHGKSGVKTLKLNSGKTQIFTHLDHSFNERSMSADDWVIYYYPGLAGRAEFIRLVFEEAGVPYKECGESHLRIKQLINQGAMEGYPHFAPPMLKKGDLQVSQTPVICRFLGEELGISPESKMDKLHAEQINVSCHDYIAEGRLAFHGIEPVGPYLSQKEATQPYIDRFVKERLPLWMRYFERVLKYNNSGTGFLYGTKISYVDLALFHIIQATEAQFPEAYQSADYMPLLKAFSQRIASRPRIAAYLKSNRHIAFSGDSMM